MLSESRALLRDRAVHHRFSTNQIMTTEPQVATDTLFSHPTDTSWTSGQETSGHEEVVDRIDQTLDLIAEATSVAAGIRPVDQYDITVIVPVFNERETLPQVLQRIEKVMPPATEVIIVDDGSTDGTSQWLADLEPSDKRTIVRRRRNHGKGSAIRLAVRHSRGRVIAIQDADLEYEPADLLRVVWPILDGDAEVVYGSRYFGGANDSSLAHRAGNWLLTTASNLTTGLRLTDMETCHKAFDGDLLRTLELRECRFGFEPEITAKVANRGARVVEVPTGYQSRGYVDGKKIGWRDALAAIGCIWRYRQG